MKKIKIYLPGIFCLGILASSCQGPLFPSANTPPLHDISWQKRLETMLPVLGHRNWILIVDKAYPAPSGKKITVINTGQNLPIVARQLDSLLKIQNHIRPIVYQDEELAYIDEQLAPGINDLKKETSTIIGSGVQVIPHEFVFKKIDSASKLFNIVVLKTESVLPYTSLFIELDCKYWDANREQELRRRISKDGNKQ